MWLSTRGGTHEAEFCASDRGTVSVGGKRPTVVSGGEQVKVSMFSPGGMCWLPRRGQGILIIKAGDLGEELCCAGAEMEIPEEMEEGELFLQSGGASIFLKNDGRILLEGQVFVNGEAI